MIWRKIPVGTVLGIAFGGANETTSKSASLPRMSKAAGIACKNVAKNNCRMKKVGYTANTSRGRVGRGESARFDPTDQQTDGRTKPLIESLVRD